VTIIQRVSRRVQPQAPVGIDWSNPINVGLACAPNFGARLYDAVTGRIPAIDSGGSIVPSARGQALKGTLALSQGANLSPSKGFDAYVPVSSDYTLSILFYVSSQTNASAGWLLGDYDAPGNATSIALFHNAAGDFSGGEYLTSGDNRFSTQGLATVGWHWFEFVRNNAAGTWTAYLDNVALPNVSSYNSNNRLSVSNGSYRINRAGAWPNFTGLNGLIAAHFIWRRALSRAERASIRNNPHQVFAPLPRRIWAPAAAGPPPTFIPSWAYRKTRTIGAGVI